MLFKPLEQHACLVGAMIVTPLGRLVGVRWTVYRNGLRRRVWRRRHRLAWLRAKLRAGLRALVQTVLNRLQPARGPKTGDLASQNGRLALNQGGL